MARGLSPLQQSILVEARRNSGQISRADLALMLYGIPKVGRKKDHPKYYVAKTALVRTFQRLAKRGLIEDWNNYWKQHIAPKLPTRLGLIHQELQEFYRIRDNAVLTDNGKIVAQQIASDT